MFVLVRFIVAWAFPTHSGLLIWRISSVAVPIYIFLMLLLAAWLDQMDMGTAPDAITSLRERDRSLDDFHISCMAYNYRNKIVVLIDKYVMI